MASSSDEQPKPPEPPAAPPHAEWAASLQAYYAAAGHHYWPAQHLMAAAAAAGVPYGSPVPFPAAAVYHPGAAAAYYAHASMAAGVPYPAGEAVAAVTAEGRTKGKDGGSGVSPEKVSSAAPSGDDASRSDDSGSEASLDTKGADSDQKDSSAAKKTKLGNSSAEGEPSQVAVMQYAVAESPYVAKGRSASKLPVSAPGRTALPSATPNLNIGIDLWSTSPAGAVPSGQGEVNTGMTLARQDSTASQLDEREWKRERRKQSNRESARRSRLRKQDMGELGCRWGSNLTCKICRTSF